MILINVNKKFKYKSFCHFINDALDIIELFSKKGASISLGTTMPDPTTSAGVRVDDAKGFPLDELRCEWM